MVDAVDSKSTELKLVSVRVRPSVYLTASQKGAFLLQKPSLFDCIFLRYNEKEGEFMTNNKKQPNKNVKKLKIDVKNMGVNIDKNEYREIVLSNSNFPDRIDSKNSYYN